MLHAGAQCDTHMQHVAGYAAVPPAIAIQKGPGGAHHPGRDSNSTGIHICRVQELLPASNADECAFRCLNTPLCAAATFFGTGSSADQSLHGRCFGRTAGPHTWFTPININQRNLDLKVISAFKHCRKPGCGLQSQLDALCMKVAMRSSARSPCRRATVASNRHAVKQFHGGEGYKWICGAAATSNSSYARLALACVDDLGYMVPCLFDGPAAGLCGAAEGTALKKELADVHRLGCGASTCMSTPGSGETMYREDGTQGPPRRDRVLDGSLSSLPLLPTWKKSNHSRRIRRLERLGYGECVARIDEGKAFCAGKNSSWTDWAWTAPGSHHKRPGPGEEPRNVTESTKLLSWWLGGSRAVDPFDADVFISELRRISQASGRPPTVHIVGDSTSRQQAVSLCCLLAAGSRQYNMTFIVPQDKKVGFKCSARSARHGLLATVEFTRIYRGDAPFDATDRLQPMLAHGILSTLAAAPPILILSFGAWDYAEGCDDRQAPTLCGGSRSYLLSLYAQKWAMVSGALRQAYPEGSPQRRHSIVAVRTNAPRSNECRDPSRKDCWGLPFATCNRPEPIFEAPGDEGRVEQLDLLALSKGTMRFAVMSQNAIMLAFVWQRVPWVHVLDAYAISRLRVDAHPGHAGDCLHYCLPGVPDIWNGRLLTTMMAPSRRDVVGPNGRTTSSIALTAPALTATAADSLMRWNFIHPLMGKPFVQGGSPPHLTLSLQGNASTAVDCTAEHRTGVSEAILGECTDL